MKSNQPTGLSFPIVAGIATLFLAASAPANQARSQDALAPPKGNVQFLSARAVGTQNYICLPNAADPKLTAWTFFGPQATLSIPLSGDYELDVAEHLLSTVAGTTLTPSSACTESGTSSQQYCPTWRSPVDQSTVWGKKVASVTAGTSPICPNIDSISCLLVKAVATSNGQSPIGFFSRTTYIQRLDTKGGSAPNTACTAGQVALVPYTATYSFYTDQP